MIDLVVDAVLLVVVPLLFGYVVGRWLGLRLGRMVRDGRGEERRRLV